MSEAALWVAIASQRKRLGLAARKMLSQGGQLALRGVPDLSLDLMMRLAHGAMVAQGAESWLSSLAVHRVHRYAFSGSGKGPPVLLLHGLGGSASSMAPLVPALTSRLPRDRPARALQWRRIRSRLPSLSSRVRTQRRWFGQQSIRLRSAILALAASGV